MGGEGKRGGGMNQTHVPFSCYCSATAAADFVAAAPVARLCEILVADAQCEAAAAAACLHAVTEGHEEDAVKVVRVSMSSHWTAYVHYTCGLWSPEVFEDADDNLVGGCSGLAVADDNLVGGCRRMWSGCYPMVSRGRL